PALPQGRRARRTVGRGRRQPRSRRDRLPRAAALLALDRPRHGNATGRPPGRGPLAAATAGPRRPHRAALDRVPRSPPTARADEPRGQSTGEPRTPHRTNTVTMVAPVQAAETAPSGAPGVADLSRRLQDGARQLQAQFLGKEEIIRLLFIS